MVLFILQVNFVQPYFKLSGCTIRCFLVRNIAHLRSVNITKKTFWIQTDLPMRRNSPTSAWRLMAMRILRTVMPSQKHATTLALGRCALSLSSRRSKLCSPALLQILPGGIKTRTNIRLWPTWFIYDFVPSSIELTFFVVRLLFCSSVNQLTQMWSGNLLEGLKPLFYNMTFITRYPSSHVCWR